MGSRESSGLQGQVFFGLVRGLKVVGALRLTISRQGQSPQKNHSARKKALIRPSGFLFGLEQGKYT